MSRKYFSLDRKAGRFPRDPAPLTVEDACLVSYPWIGFAIFHLRSCIFIRSDDADRFLKASKPCGCTVSTMGLSEARGLVLFRVIRGGIGVTRRLGARRHRVDYRPLAYSPSNPSVSKTDRPPPEKSPEMEGALHPRRSSGLRFQFFCVEVLSLLPKSQRNCCHLAR